MVRTISGAIIFGSPSLYKTSLPCDHPKEPPLARGRVSRARPRVHGARRSEPPARVRRRARLRIPRAADAVRPPGARDAGARAHRRLDPRAPPRHRRHRRRPELHARDAPGRDPAPAELPRPIPARCHRARAVPRALGHPPPGYQPLFAVLFDMVADKDQQFYYEGNSQAVAPEVVDRVWRVAADLGYGGVFIPGVRHTLTDDHVALQQAGIHAIDVVDFDYPYWHTTDDTIDKVSAASLQVVGDVAIALVRQ